MLKTCKQDEEKGKKTMKYKTGDELEVINSFDRKNPTYPEKKTFLSSQAVKVIACYEDRYEILGKHYNHSTQEFEEQYPVSVEIDLLEKNTKMKHANPVRTGDMFYYQDEGQTLICLVLECTYYINSCSYRYVYKVKGSKNPHLNYGLTEQDEFLKNKTFIRNVFDFSVEVKQSDKEKLLEIGSEYVPFTNILSQGRAYMTIAGEKYTVSCVRLERTGGHHVVGLIGNWQNINSNDIELMNNNVFILHKNENE